MPKLTEQSFDPLPHAAVQLSLLRYLSSRDQQQLVFLYQQLSQLRPVVAQIRQHYASIDCLRQFTSRASIIEIARSQHRVNDATVDVAQCVQFKTKEPARAGFAKIRSGFTQQTDSPVLNDFANRNGLGIQQLKSASAEKTSRDKHPTDDWTEAMQASNPLLVRRKLREGRGKVGSNEFIILLERSHAEIALHQGNGDDFRIRESGLMIGRGSPMRQSGMRFSGMRFKGVINKAVEISHLVYNGRQMGRPPSDRLSLQLHSIHSRNYGDPAFQLNTRVY